MNLKRFVTFVCSAVDNVLFSKESRCHPSAVEEAVFSTGPEPPPAPIRPLTLTMKRDLYSPRLQGAQRVPGAREDCQTFDMGVIYAGEKLNWVRACCYGSDTE